MNSLEFLSNLGRIVILGIVGLPVVLLLLTTLLGGPKGGSVKALFLGALVIIIGGFLTMTAVMSSILSFIVP